VIDEIAHRQLAKENLPPADHVEEVVVGQSGKRTAGVIEAKEPGNGKEPSGRHCHAQYAEACPPDGEAESVDNRHGRRRC